MTKQTGLAAAVKKPANPDEWVKAAATPAAKAAEPGKRARLVVEVPDELHARIKIKCAEQRLKIKDVTEQLFQLWIEGKVQI